LPAADGKKYLTDVGSPETLLRIIQSVPSPKAEPIKLWLAKVGYHFAMRHREMKGGGRGPARPRGFGGRWLLGYFVGGFETEIDRRRCSGVWFRRCETGK